MISQAHLPGDDDVVLNNDAPGNAGLGCNGAVLADLDVVAHLNQVVNFGAAAYAGCSQGATVYGGVGANLNLVFQQYIVADLGSGVDSRPSRRMGKKKLQGPSEAVARVADTDRGSIGQAQSQRRQQASRSGCHGLREAPLRLYEGNFPF